MRYFFILFFTSCSLFHRNEAFELEEIASDVLKDKQGVKITVEPIEEKK